MAGVSQVSHLVHVENSSSKDEYDHHKDIPHTATGLGQKQNDFVLSFAEEKELKRFI